MVSNSSFERQGEHARRSQHYVTMRHDGRDDVTPIAAGRQVVEACAGERDTAAERTPVAACPLPRWPQRADPEAEFRDGERRHRPDDLAHRQSCHAIPPPSTDEASREALAEGKTTDEVARRP